MSVYNGMDYATLLRVSKYIWKRQKVYYEKMADDEFPFLDSNSKLVITTRYSELDIILSMLSGFMNDAEPKMSLEAAKLIKEEFKEG